MRILPICPERPFDVRLRRRDKIGRCFGRAPMAFSLAQTLIAVNLPTRVRRRVALRMQSRQRGERLNS
jgi:hypothetical protein